VRTAVDTSVLLDVLGADAQFGERSRDALRTAYRSGALVACDVVWAEVRACFPDEESFQEVLGVLGLRFDAIRAESAALAGRLWRQHRRRQPAGHGRLVADFLIGAHARIQAEALLTRDRGFYRAYFSGLRILDPS
jgi:predicted nucleic acid-binding protein